MKVLQPAGWKRPKGYANGISARGRTIHVAGQIGWNGNEQFESDDLVQQVAQALRNIVAVLAEDDALPEHKRKPLDRSRLRFGARRTVRSTGRDIRRRASLP